MQNAHADKTEHSQLMKQFSLKGAEMLDDTREWKWSELRKGSKLTVYGKWKLFKNKDLSVGGVRSLEGSRLKYKMKADNKVACCKPWIVHT